MTDYAAEAERCLTSYDTVSPSNAEGLRDAGYDLADLVVSLAREVDRLRDRLDTIDAAVPSAEESLRDVANTWDTRSSDDNRALYEMIGNLYDAVRPLTDRTG